MRLYGRDEGKEGDDRLGESAEAVLQDFIDDITMHVRIYIGQKPWRSCRTLSCRIKLSWMHVYICLYIWDNSRGEVVAAVLADSYA